MTPFLLSVTIVSYAVLIPYAFWRYRVWARGLQNPPKIYEGDF